MEDSHLCLEKVGGAPPPPARFSHLSWWVTWWDNSFFAAVLFFLMMRCFFHPLYVVGHVGHFVDIVSYLWGNSFPQPVLCSCCRCRPASSLSHQTTPPRQAKPSCRTIAERIRFWVCRRHHWHLSQSGWPPHLLQLGTQKCANRANIFVEVASVYF